MWNIHVNQTMKSTITVSLLQALLVFTFAEAHVSAADWPQWRGPSRDGKADFKVPTTWPKELTKKWQVTVGDGVSTPALAGGKLYVAVNGSDGVAVKVYSTTDESLVGDVKAGPAASYRWNAFDITADGQWLLLKKADDISGTTNKLYKQEISTISGTAAISRLSFVVMVLRRTSTSRS